MRPQLPLQPKDPDAIYEDFASFKIGDQEVHLETKDEELFLCLPDGCVSVPATGDSIAKWVTFMERLSGVKPDA